MGANLLVTKHDNNNKLLDATRHSTCSSWSVLSRLGLFSHHHEVPPLDMPDANSQAMKRYINRHQGGEGEREERAVVTNICIDNILQSTATHYQSTLCLPNKALSYSVSSVLRLPLVNPLTLTLLTHSLRRKPRYRARPRHHLPRPSPLRRHLRRRTRPDQGHRAE